MTLPTLAGIEEALPLVRAVQLETPLVRSELLSRALAADVWLKNETVSPVASFKLRGATTALGRAAGLRLAVTSSTGNHGQGVAFAARARGVPAHVFLPEVANPVKREMIEALGAEIHQVGHDLDAAKERALAFARERGGLFVDDGESLDLMEGAGTAGLEVARSLPGVEVVYVPMGSGTLVSGCAAAVKAVQPGARVVAVQAKGSPAMVASFHARRAIEQPAETIADGLTCRVPATLALRALWALVDDAVALDDETLLAATRSVIESAHVLVEPSGAAALAGAWSQRHALRGRRVVLVLTGSNVSAATLARALALAPLTAEANSSG